MLTDPASSGTIQNLQVSVVPGVIAGTGKTA